MNNFSAKLIVLSILFVGAAQAGGITVKYQGDKDHCVCVYMDSGLTSGFNSANTPTTEDFKVLPPGKHEVWHFTYVSTQESVCPTTNSGFTCNPGNTDIGILDFTTNANSNGATVNNAYANSGLSISPLSGSTDNIVIEYVETTSKGK